MTDKESLKFKDYQSVRNNMCWEMCSRIDKHPVATFIEIKRDLGGMIGGTAECDTCGIQFGVGPLTDKAKVGLKFERSGTYGN